MVNQYSQSFLFTFSFYHCPKAKEEHDIDIHELALGWWIRLAGFGKTRYVIPKTCLAPEAKRPELTYLYLMTPPEHSAHMYKPESLWMKQAYCVIECVQQLQPNSFAKVCGDICFC